MLSSTLVSSILKIILSVSAKMPSSLVGFSHAKSCGQRTSAAEIRRKALLFTLLECHLLNETSIREINLGVIIITIVVSCIAALTTMFLYTFSSSEAFSIRFGANRSVWCD